MKQIVILGFFDGVHLGHGALLRKAAARRAELSMPTLALSFDRHPGSVISGQEQTLITTPEDRAWLMQTLYQVDAVDFLHFGKALMHMPWREFAERFLLQEADAGHVICGWDYRFGYRGEGNAELLRAFCAEHDIGCDVIPEYSVEGTAVHSTLIRTMLEHGELRHAEQLLGHPFMLSGTVVSGKQLGRTMGTPTANLRVPDTLVRLPRGVYAAQVLLEGSLQDAVLNIGVCPTVSTGETLMLEVWLSGFSGNLYGRELRVFFRDFLRPEQRFESVEALQQAILADGKHAETVLKELKDNLFSQQNEDFRIPC